MFARLGARAVVAVAAPAAALCDARPTPAERCVLDDRRRRERVLRRYLQSEGAALYRKHCQGAERSRTCAAARDLIADRSHTLSHPDGTTRHHLEHYHERARSVWNRRPGKTTSLVRGPILATTAEDPCGTSRSRLSVRRSVSAGHGCTRCTPDAATACAEACAAARADRVVEVGAGRGHWAAKLAAKGLEVRAFDDGSDVPAAGAEDVYEIERGSGGDLGGNETSQCLQAALSLSAA